MPSTRKERPFSVMRPPTRTPSASANARSFRVDGIAVTAAVPVYSQVCFYSDGCSGPAGRPASFDTGLVWVTRAAARSLGDPGNPLTYYLNLRLAHPAAAPPSCARTRGCSGRAGRR